MISKLYPKLEIPTKFNLCITLKPRFQYHTNPAFCIIMSRIMRDAFVDENIKTFIIETQDRIKLLKTPYLHGNTRWYGSYRILAMVYES